MALQLKYDTLPNKSLRVTLNGRLDAVTSDQLDQFITTQTAQPIGNLIFNLKNLEFVSSAGLRIFAKSRKLMKAKKGKTLFINLQPQVQKVFDLVKAVPVDDVFANDQELDAYLARLQATPDNQWKGL